MFFIEAADSFKAAISRVNSANDPATWNMLNGLIKLSESLNYLHNETREAKSQIDKISTAVRQIKNR